MNVNNNNAPNPKIVFYIDGQNLCRRVAEDSERFFRKNCQKEAERELTKVGKLNAKDLQKLTERKVEEKKHSEIMDARLLDIRGLCIKLALTLETKFDLHIKYYAARFPIEIDSTKHLADQAYYKTLEEEKIIFREGKILYDKAHFKKHGHAINVREKGVDVKLAVDLLTDVMSGQFQHAVVISQDTDLQPAYEAVNGMGKIVHIRSTKKMEGFNVCTTSNEIIPMFMLKSVYKANVPATLVSIESLTKKFGKN